MKLPLLLTVARISLIPIIWVVYLLPYSVAHTAAALLFLVAGATDFFDGYLARHMHQVSKLGAFLDPVADKLLVCTLLVLLVNAHIHWLVVLPATLIIVREITISALREWMAERGKRSQVAVISLGKVKTGFQIAAIGFLLWYSPGMSFFGIWHPHHFEGVILPLGLCCLWLAMVLTWWSMLIYLRSAWRDLTLESETQ